MTANVWTLEELFRNAPDFLAYERALAEAERIKAEAEPAFRAALEAGCVLVEHWLCGVEPSSHVWTGREKWERPGYSTAAHVANRFRAGWTRVEVRPAR